MYVSFWKCVAVKKSLQVKTFNTKLKTKTKTKRKKEKSKKTKKPKNKNEILKYKTQKYTKVPNTEIRNIKLEI